jgi:hypothetical protein
MPFDCREVLCIAPARQLFQYHATGKQVPHASCGKMTSSSPPTRRLPLPYQKHGYCRVPFAFLSSESLFSPRERVLSVMAYVRSECCSLVLFYVNTLLTTLVNFLNGNMCHICEIFCTFFPADSKNLVSVLKIVLFSAPTM